MKLFVSIGRRESMEGWGSFQTHPRSENEVKEMS
jgi:hypothetical protein